MHALILAMIAAAVLADNQAQLKQKQEAADAVVRQSANKGANSSQPVRCAIPLTHVLGDKAAVNPMPVKVPQGRFFIRQVTPPAPSCDDVKKSEDTHKK